MATGDTGRKEMEADSLESINRESKLKHEEGDQHYPDVCIKPENLTAQKYKLYARRWLMLAVVAVFNMSNGMIWISYAPIANYAADYYKVSLTAVNWFSLVFFLTFIPCGFFSFWIVDSLGLKSGVLSGTWLNALGALLRMAVSLVDLNPNVRFALALTGQVISGCAQPMALSMPTKLSAFWFGERERTISNTISSLANPVGVLVANILSPLLVHHGSDIKVMVIVLAIPAVFSALLGTITFRSNKPPTPPSPSAEETSTPFKHVLLKAFQNRHYVVLMLTIGCGVAIFSAFSSVIFEAICPQGYSNLTAGIAGALLIVGGIVGSTITSLYVDRTKKFEETIKIAALLISLSFSFLVVVTNMRDQSVAICIGCFFLGVVGLGALPVGLELGVEVTYPLAEATTSGLLWMTGQIIGVVILVILPYLGRDLTAQELKASTCSTGTSASIGGAKDLSPVTMLMAVLTAAIVIIFVISFKADLRRLKMEFDRRVLDDQID